MARTARIALLQIPAFSMDQAAASLAHTMRRIDETVAAEHPDLIALPEVTYPAYFLGSVAPPMPGVLSPDDAVSAFREKARQHGTYLAVGLALDAPGGGYANGALLVGRDGGVAGRYDKSFLWHFDSRWFEAGSAFPVFDTDLGRIGMLVCADGRMPEIARLLAIGGAELILDLTAWVSGARESKDLTTTQVEHLMRTRAAENGIWIACADKFGVEAESIVYAGRSCFIDPRGEIVAALGTEEDRALVYDVPLARAEPLITRRPGLYEVLCHPTESLPVIRALGEQFVPQEHEKRIAVVQAPMPGTGGEFVELARRHVERQALMDADLVLFPATPSRVRRAYAHDEVVAGMQALAEDAGVTVAFVVWRDGGEGLRMMYLVGPRGVIASHAQTHKPPGERFATMPMGDVPCPVVQTPIGRVGLMLAAEGMAPEVARSLMLRGAEIILWAGDDPDLEMLPVARTRAEENRVFVAAAAAPSDTGATLIADPNGRMLAVALRGRHLAVGAEVNRALAHIKERSPGTDVVRNRQPGAYTALVSSGTRAS